MIDIHAHILPGLDDGAGDLASALAMAELAVESGVRAIVATPHCNMPGRFTNYWGAPLQRHWNLFRRALEEAAIPLKLYSGMEVFGTPSTPALLMRGKLATLGGSRYLLIEFPFHDYAEDATQILSSLAALGCCPVVAHPERYCYVQSNPTLINRWIRMGCLLQLNRGSLLGRFGYEAEAMAISLLDRGFATAVATDAHSPVMRTTWLMDIWELISQEYSEEAARLLMEENPLRMLQNMEIQMPEPEWF